MGNATMKGYWPPPGMVTIVLAGGRTEQYNKPVSAGDIMLHHPRHHVVRPDFFRSSPVNVLEPEEVLTPGHKFFLIPFHTVTKKFRRREESLLRSSSHSSTCRGSIKDCTKASIGLGKKGATRIPAGRLTVLRKGSPSPGRSTRQARKTLLPKEKLLSTSRRRPSMEERRRTTIKSHMRKNSADSEAAFEPPPDVTELDMFDSEDYMECISCESPVVLPKPAASLDLSVPEYKSLQSSAKSSMSVESLLTSVKEQETSNESPGTPKIEGLIFKDFIPAKIFFNPNGGTSGLGETWVEKQPEQSSKGYVLPKIPQAPSNGRASLADHIVQEGVDSPKAARLASDKYVSLDGKMQNVVDFHKAAGVPILDKSAPLYGWIQKGVDSPKAARPALEKGPFDGKVQKGVDSHKAARPVLDKCGTFNDKMQKEVDSPSEPLLALSGFASSDAAPEKRVDSPKAARPALEKGPFDGKVQKGVDSHKAARPVLDKCGTFNDKMQKEVDSPSEPLLALSGFASSDAAPEKRVDSPKAARPALEKGPFDGKVQKGVDSHKAARPVLDKCGTFNDKMQKEVDSPSEPPLALSGYASSDAAPEKRVHSSKPERPFVYGIASVDYISNSRLRDYRKSEDLKRLSESTGPSTGPSAFYKWAPLSEQLTVKIAAHSQPAITNSGGPNALGQQQPQPPSREKNLVSYLREPERPLTPITRSEPQQQKEGSEVQVGYPLFYAAPGFAPGKGKIEVKSRNSRSVKPSAGPPQVDPKSVVMVKQESVTTLVKKQTPALGYKLINHLCFAPRQGSETPLHPAAAAAAVPVAAAAAAAAASGDTQEKQRREQRLKLIDHLKCDQNSPPNQQNILKQSAATSVNLQIQQYIVPIAESGSTGSGMEAKARTELVAFQLRQAVKTATVRFNNANEVLTPSIEGKFLKLPPTNLFRPRRIRTTRRIYSAHWRPRLSPLVEFSPTHSELSVKS